MSQQIDNHPPYSPRFRVTVGGKTFQEPGGRIADLAVKTTLEGADQFSFTLNYPFDEELDTFAGLTWSDFSIGTDVTIAMGYGSDGKLSKLFKGKIRSIDGEFKRDSGPSVTISGYGLLWEMIQGRNSNSWEKTTVTKVVTDILSSYSFSNIEVEGPKIKRRKFMQDNMSDYKFIKHLASTYGFRFVGRRDTVEFKPRSGYKTNQKSVRELWYGEELHDFFAEIKKQQDNYRVQVRSWNPRKKKEIVATAGGKDAKHEQVYRIPAESHKEAKQVAEAKYEQIDDGVVEGHGKADGIPEIAAGKIITLKELGKKFSGKYRVEEATHRMGERGYETTFDIKEVGSGA